MTKASFLALVKNPHFFVNEDFVNFEESSEEINNSTDISAIQCLEIGYVYDDMTVEILFPFLFEIIQKISFKNKDETINVTEMFEGTNFKTYKDLLIKLYLEFARICHVCYVEEPLTPSFFNEDIIKQFFSLFISSEIPKYKVPETEALTENKDLPEEKPVVEQSESKAKTKKLSKISIKTYSLKHGIKQQTVQRWIYADKLKSAKLINGKWMIDEDEPLPKGTAARKRAEEQKENYKFFSVADDMPYEVVQGTIWRMNWYTYEIRKYIRTVEEAKYYIDNKFFEVILPDKNGKHVLVKDINPNYYCPEYGKTNKELILEGRSPVMPYMYMDDRKTPDTVVLHHIGQHKDSPFRTVRESHHSGMFKSEDGTTTWGIFHQSSRGEAIHGRKFDLVRKSFWLSYLNAYEDAGTFENMIKMYGPDEKEIDKIYELEEDN